MTAGAAVPWTLGPQGVLLRVRVTPKSAKDAVEGIEEVAQGPALKVRVRAVPDKGAANIAVVSTVARWLGVPKSTVSLQSGSTARVKNLAIAGDPTALMVELARRVGEVR